MFAPSHTLLLITSRVLARVDLSGRRRLRVQNVWIQACTEPTSPTAAAGIAFNLGPRRAGRVWVLSNDFWTGVLSLAADVSPLLSATELNQALALEAEIDSGISAFASQVGALRLAEHSVGDTRWCVTHVSTADLQYLSEAMKHSNVQVAGVAHPAAAQIWKAATNDSLDAEEILRGWEERFAPPDDSSPDDTRAAVTALAECWADCLAHPPLTPLAIRFDPKPLSPAQRMMASAAMAMLTAGACGFWHWQTQQRILTADREIARLEERQTAQEATQRNLQSLEARLAKLRKETSQAQAQHRALENDLYRADRTHAQHNYRWSALLDAIAVSIDNQCWIQRLESKPVQATVHGLAIDNAAAHRFASALEVGLQDSGWTVLPAETKLTEHRLVAFKIVLDANPGPAKGDEAVGKLSALSAAMPAAFSTSLQLGPVLRAQSKEAVAR